MQLHTERCMLSDKSVTCIVIPHSLQILTWRALLSLLICCFSSCISCSLSSFSACRRLWVFWFLWRSWFRLSTSSFKEFSRPLDALAESFAAWSSSLSSCTRTFREGFFSNLKGKVGWHSKVFLTRNQKKSLKQWMSICFNSLCIQSLIYCILLCYRAQL